jgi:hypothetical protein
MKSKLKRVNQEGASYDQEVSDMVKCQETYESRVLRDKGSEISAITYCYIYIQ